MNFEEFSKNIGKLRELGLVCTPCIFNTDKHPNWVTIYTKDTNLNIGSIFQNEPLYMKAFIEKIEKDGTESILDTCDIEDILGCYMQGLNENYFRGTIRNKKDK
jgi:hypothetical protein